MYSIKKINDLWLAFLFMVLSAFFPLVSLAQPVDWAISTIDTGDVGLHTSVAIDSNNKVHISYYDGTNYALKYATDASGDWITSTIDSTEDVGQFSSIAIDSNNHVHISYYDGTNHALKYATDASEDWITSTIDSTGDVGQFSSIAIDSNNHVHISYYDATNYALKYAVNASGYWATSTIDSVGDVGQFSSIAIDSNNKVHISYYDATNHTLKYATDASGYWVRSTIDNAREAGQFSSIAVDSDNHVHISYYTVGYQVYTIGTLKYATNASGDWVTSTIDGTGGVQSYTSIGVGLYTSIAIDSNNKVHISYYDGVNHDLRYFTIAPGHWGVATIDGTGDVGTFSSIAVDSNNIVHISYYDATNGELKYAETLPPPCPTPRTPTPASPANGVTGISTTPTLLWSREATTSSVQICSDSACNNVVTSASSLTSRSWTVSPALNNNTPYWWRVKTGSNSCGNSSQWSGTSSFTTMTLQQSTTYTSKISVAPLSVNLGSVRVGGISNAKTVAIKNTAKEAFVLNSITITGTNQSEFSYINNCSILPAKSECSILVTFSPAAPFAKKSGIMSISFNDPKKTTMNVKLSGQAPPPKISLSPHSVNFGSAAVGTTSAAKVVRVRNAGISDLTINGITFAGTNAAEFTHTSDCTTVAKGGSCMITIAFSPTSADIKTATMSISSSDPKKSSLNVKLKGKGI